MNITELSTSFGSQNDYSTSPSITHMFIKHINLLPNDHTFFQRPINLVVFYGILKSKLRMSGRVYCIFEDFSDRIDAHYWIISDLGQQEILKLNSYYRVIGNIKDIADENKRIIIIRNMKLLECFDELLMHYQLAIVTRLENENNSNMDHQNVTINHSTTEPHPGLSTSNDVSRQVGNMFQNYIYQIICNQTKNTSQHVHIDAIQQISRCPKIEILAALNYLIAEGHIITTVTDDYFMPVFEYEVGENKRNQSDFINLKHLFGQFK